MRCSRHIWPARKPTWVLRRECRQVKHHAAVGIPAGEGGEGGGAHWGRLLCPLMSATRPPAHQQSSGVACLATSVSVSGVLHGMLAWAGAAQ